MNLKTGFMKTSVDYNPKNELPYVYDIATGYCSGGYLFKERDDRSRLQLNADVSFFKDGWAGSHEFKAGVEAQFTNARTSYKYKKDPVNDMTFIFSYAGTPPIWILGCGYRQKRSDK